MLSVVLTLGFVAIMLYALSKKMYAQTILFLLAGVAMIIWSLVTGNSMMGDASCGNLILDVFEYGRGRMVSAFTGIGVTICCAMGYAAYMSHIKAAPMLAALLCVPLKKLKSPYIVAGLGIIMGTVIKMGIPSASSVCAVTIATLYPVMLACGLPRKSAAATLMMGTAVSFGPADFSQATALPLIAPAFSPTDTFVPYQIPVFTPVTILFAIAACIWMAIVDKKEGAQPDESALGDLTPSQVGCPLWYGIMPMLPVIMLLVTAAIGIEITVEANCVMWLLIAMVIEIIRKGSKQPITELVNETKIFWREMGTNFTNVVMLTAAAYMCSGLIGKLGGFSILADFAVNMGIPAILCFGMLVVFQQIIVFATGSPNGAQATMATPYVELAARYGYEPVTVSLMSSCGAGLARMYSPVAAVTILVMGSCNVTLGDLIKREIVPGIVATIGVVVCSFLFII